MKITKRNVHHEILKDLQPYSNGLSFDFAWDLWNHKFNDSNFIYSSILDLVEEEKIFFKFGRVIINRV